MDIVNETVAQIGKISDQYSEGVKSGRELAIMKRTNDINDRKMKLEQLFKLGEQGKSQVQAAYDYGGDSAAESVAVSFIGRDDVKSLLNDLGIDPSTFVQTDENGKMVSNSFVIDRGKIVGSKNKKYIESNNPFDMDINGKKMNYTPGVYELEEILMPNGEVRVSAVNQLGPKEIADIKAKKGDIKLQELEGRYKQSQISRNYAETKKANAETKAINLKIEGKPISKQDESIIANSQTLASSLYDLIKSNINTNRLQQARSGDFARQVNSVRESAVKLAKANGLTKEQTEVVLESLPSRLGTYDNIGAAKKVLSGLKSQLMAKRQVLADSEYQTKAIDNALNVVSSQLEDIELALASKGQ